MTLSQNHGAGGPGGSGYPSFEVNRRFMRKSATKVTMTTAEMVVASAQWTASFSMFATVWDDLDGVKFLSKFGGSTHAVRSPNDGRYRGNVDTGLAETSLGSIGDNADVPSLRHCQPESQMILPDQPITEEFKPSSNESGARG